MRDVRSRLKRLMGSGAWSNKLNYCLSHFHSINILGQMFRILLYASGLNR